MVAERERLLAAEQKKLAEAEAATAREQEGRANQQWTQLLDLSNRACLIFIATLRSCPGQRVRDENWCRRLSRFWRD